MIQFRFDFLSRIKIKLPNKFCMLGKNQWESLMIIDELTGSPF